MKIFSVAQIKEADNYTIKHEPIKSIDLMERAAKACCQWITKNVKNENQLFIFCGKGNNGGDGLAIARLLSTKYSIEVFIVEQDNHSSDDFLLNFKRLSKLKNVVIHHLKKPGDLTSIKLNNKNNVIIDSIFGTGLNRAPENIAAECIDYINRLNAIVVAIDIPSGLFCDDNSSNDYKHIVNADYTLTFQFPKISFLFPENDSLVGQCKVLPIDLSEDYIYKTKTENILIEDGEIIPLFKQRKRFSHKGTYGHALLIAGSKGKMGAAILSSKACLHSGVGLLTTHVPKIAYEIIQTSVPEAMASIDESDNNFSGFIDISKFNAIAIGPGIGTDRQTQNALKLLIQNSSLPIIFDADAINILSENKTWLSFLPKSCIFTPHPKEFERLVGKSANSNDRLKIQKEFSKKYNAYLIYKGAYTTISCPDGQCFFNSNGNPGMATAGSGDVLTGIILGLQAQHYSPKEAAIIGVYVHGMAGDLFSNKKSMTSLTATGIIENLSEVYKYFENKTK